MESNDESRRSSEEADRNEQWILKHLVEMCRDEELTLRYAADHVKEPTVKRLFTELASRRAQFAAELLPHAQRLGAVAGDSTTRGRLHRSWMAIRDALIGYSERQMITEAEHDEQVVLTAYESALKDLVPPTARDLLERQCEEVRQAHDRLRAFASH